MLTRNLLTTVLIATTLFTGCGKQSENNEGNSVQPITNPGPSPTPPPVQTQSNYSFSMSVAVTQVELFQQFVVIIANNGSAAFNAQEVNITPSGGYYLSHSNQCYGSLSPGQSCSRTLSASVEGTLTLDASFNAPDGSLITQQASLTVTSSNQNTGIDGNTNLAFGQHTVSQCETTWHNGFLGSVYQPTSANFTYYCEFAGPHFNTGSEVEIQSNPFTAVQDAIDNNNFDSFCPNGWSGFAYIKSTAYVEEHTNWYGGRAWVAVSDVNGQEICKARNIGGCTSWKTFYPRLKSFICY